MMETQDVGAFSACVWQPDKHETIYVKIEDDNEPYYIADERPVIRWVLKTHVRPRLAA